MYKSLPEVEIRELNEQAMFYDLAVPNYESTILIFNLWHNTDIIFLFINEYQRVTDEPVKTAASQQLIQL